MGSKYIISQVGTAEVDKKWIKCDFSISYDDFIAKYGGLLGDDLPINEIEKAIDSPGKEIKIGKKDQKPLENFFQSVKSKADEKTSKTVMGFSADERSESATADSMKSYSSNTTKISYTDGDTSTDGIETYDARTGVKEGEILLGEEGATGELVPLEIVETLEAHYEFNADEDIEADRKVSGQFKVTNPSTTNKIWDVDITFENDESGVLSKATHINNLDPNAEEVIDYEITELEEPALKINEFISTLNDEETLSYSLSTTTSNVILFKITATNTKDYDLLDVKVNKEIQSGYSGVEVLSSSIGEASSDMNTIEWTIAKLPAGSEAVLKVNMTIDLNNADEKVRTGKITSSYSANKSITGIEIDKFDAYSDNFVGIMQEQQDDDPDKFTCQVWFKNESDFQMQLVNLDVVEASTQEKVIDIDPNDIPIIAAGATWKSVEWETEMEDEEEPEFHKTVEFFLVSKRKITTSGSLTFDDIELAVAMMNGILNYSTEAIASYRVVPFDSLHQVKNTGGADLNEIIFEETVQAGYIPPKAEDIELYIIRPEDEDTINEDLDPEAEVDWDDLGEEISINKDMIEITPNDQEPDTEHVVRINLTELRDNPIGMFVPGMIVKAKYPIQAYKVGKEQEFVSDVKYLGNTYPAGAPIEIIPAEQRIPVIHLRKKLLRGKKIRALPIEGQYQIILTVQNTGIFALENIEMKDVIPENFEYSDYSLEPSKFENLEDKDVLIWTIDRIEPNESYEITFTITGQGEDYKASAAQFSI